MVGTKRGNRFFNSGFQLTVEISLLALLASGTPLKSQSIQDRARRLEMVKACTELSDDLAGLTPEVGSATSVPATVIATALENVSSPTERPASVVPLDSSNISKPRDGKASCAVSFSGTRDLPQHSRHETEPFGRRQAQRGLQNQLYEFGILSQSIETEASITKTGSNSEWTSDTFPSISRLSSMFS